MKTRTKFFAAVLLILSGAFVTNAQSPCLNAPNGQYPFSTFTPTCTGSPQVITAIGWAGEYSVVALTAGTTYIFTSSVATDWITIGDAAGTTGLAAGLGPVSYTPTASGNYRFYTHLSSACGDEQVDRTRSVQCSNTPPPPPTPCLNAPNGQYPFSTFTPTCTGSPQVITAIGWAGEYSVVALTAGTTYIFTSSVATDWITIGNATGTTGLAAGLGPVSYTPTASGNYRFYTHLSSACGDAQVDRTRSVQCSSAPPAVPCLTATYGQYPFFTFTPTCTGSPQAIAADCYAGEYSLVTLTAGTAYTFTSSIATDYITISNEGGTTGLAAGLGPINYTPTTTGNYRFYLHTNSSCGESMAFRTRSVQCAGAPPPPGPCLSATYGQWPGTTFTPTCTGNPENITTNGWAGEYSVVALTAGTAYTFTSSIATDWITISDAAGTIGLAFGLGPVSYTPTTSGNYRFYTHTNSACGEEQVSRTRSVQCPPPPPANNDCASVTPQALAVPGSLTFSGSSVGATDNSVGQSYGSAQVWEAFTLTNCANVTLNYCGTTPTLATFFSGISGGCPASFPGNYIVNTTIADCGDGNPSITFNNLQPGTYFVPVWGGVSYALSIVATPSLPAPTITPGGPTTFCAGGSVDLTASSSATSFSWSPATGLNTATGAQVTATPSGNATYTVTATDLNGCSSSASISITVNQPAAAPTVGAPVTICQGVSLGEVSASAGGLNISWYDQATGGALLGTGTTLNVVGTSVMPNSNTPGAYTVYAEAASAQGCPGPRTSASVIVSPTYSGGVQNNVICQGDSINFGGSFYNTAGSFIHTFQTINGCDSSVTLNLAVNPSFTGIVQNNTICEGDSISFGGTFYNAGGSYTSTFPTINGCDSTVTLNLTVNPVYTGVQNTTICDGESVDFGGVSYDEEGSYPFTFQTVNGCDSTVTLNLTVTPLPNADFSVSGTSPTFTFTSTSANTTGVSWNFGDGSPADQNATANHTYTTNGTFTVTLTATNSCGTDTETEDVEVFGIGINELSGLENLNIFPNPTDALLNISFQADSPKEMVLKIVDAQGKTIFVENLGTVAQEFSRMLDVTHLAPGVYMLSLESADGSKAVQRFVKH
jgi:hypothetical protein